MQRQLVLASLVLVLLAAPLLAASPAGVVDPHVKTDTSVDWRTVDSVIKSVVKKGMTDEEKVLAVFHTVRRMYVHGPTPERLAYDFHKAIQVLGTGACLTMTTPLQVLYDRMGYKCRSWVHDGHHMMEVFYGDSWHCLDPHMSFYCYDRSTPPKIASVQQLQEDPTLAGDAVQEGRAGKGYLLCGDSPKWFAGKQGRWYIESRGQWPKMKIDEPFGRITLRRGESYVRTWAPGKYWYKKGWLTQDGCGPIHHCGPADRKDSANWPLFEPHAAKPPIGSQAGRTFYKIYGVGRLLYAPALQGGRYADAVVRQSNVALAERDGVAFLQQKDSAKPGEVVFSVACPYVITAGELGLARAGKGSIAAEVSTDAGKSWKALKLAAVGEMTFTSEEQDKLRVGSGRFAIARPRSASFKCDKLAATFVDEVNGSFEGYWLKLTLTGGVQMGKPELTSHFQLNRFSLPYFVPGRNVVSVTAEGYGSPLSVTCKWAEGPGWATAKSMTRTFRKDGRVEVQVAGPKWPRMESLTLSVAP